MIPTGDVHDFDFLIGSWAVHNRRLRRRGVGSDEWYEFEATSTCRQQLGGVVNVDEITCASEGFSGLTFRAFDLARSQWSIWWVNSTSGTLEPPVQGGFDGDDGEFFGDDLDDGRPIAVRFRWTAGPAPRWEQAFSYDSGPWETNWIMEFTRLGR
jgi:hypothetical protein